MESYLFHGIVLPERAQLTFQCELSFSHLATGTRGKATVSIILNQVAVWVESKHDWDIYDLRNVIKYIVQNELAIIGYLKGYAYEFQMIRIINQSRKIDYVFGIDIPCLAERGKSINLNEALSSLRKKTEGPNGMLLHRCFNDLISSMKHAEDTGFYCYRAIESLRLHCAKLYGLSTAGKAKQWEKFREVTECDEQTLFSIKTAADPLRHGDIAVTTSNDREKLFTVTWNVVDGYLKSI